MHLDKLFEQLKHHPAPEKALDKLGKVFESHETNLMEKGYQTLKSKLCNDVYEAINGPHFDEEHAREAVNNMENEDGSKGPHWTVEETTAIANQMGVNLKSDKCNKWDWYVAMNMIYSDYYKVISSITGRTDTKYFAEFAKAWINDKDISEGKMWHYYIYIMSDCFDHDYEDEPRYYGRYSDSSYGRYRREPYVEPEYYDRRMREIEPEMRRNTSIRYY